MRGFIAGATSTGAVGGEQHGRGEIVGEAVRHPGKEIGGRRRDHDQVGLAREPDVTDIVLVLAVEELGEHLPAGDRADRERRHEFLRRPGHHRAHRRAALAQPPDQVERLVGGDAAGDDEEDAFRAGARCQPSRTSWPGRSELRPLSDGRHFTRRCDF